MTKTKMMMSHEGFLVILLFIITFALSASQYSDSPQNIETYYHPPSYYYPSPSPAPAPAPATATPYVSPPPPPPPQPPSPSLAPEPGSFSRTKKVMTVVGVTAASVLAAAALVFLLVSRWSKSRRSQDGNQNGNEATTTTTSREAEETKMDEEGLDVKYWNELQKTVSTSASRVHPLPVGATQTEDQPPPTHLVDVSVGHSQYNGDIVGALFGTVAGNRENSDPDAKVFILDPLKSREMTAVLTSIGVSQDDLIGALLRGKGVNEETLGKLISVAPTRDEQSRILAFDDDPAMLAHAESFLYTLLKMFPSAFTRIQWRLKIDSDMVEKVIKPLQILESGCDELRSRDTFLKLLQAVHNAAARLRAPSESNKLPGFDLNTVGKLSEYRSTDGTTTLLHFVVHQVVRNEGRRCVLNRSNSISRQNRTEPDVLVKEDKEKEFLMMGLPIVGGLSSEFSNARKAGEIDYDSLKDSLASLVNRVKEVMPPGGAGGGFVESADLDIKAAQLEHKRVINLVKKVAQYYQAGDSNPVQLFVIVKEFLTRIDQACVEIARTLQQHGSGSDPSQPDVLKTRVNFHRLPPDFFSS